MSNVARNVDFNSFSVISCLSRFVSPSVANVFRSFEVILNFALQVKLEGHPAYDINFVGITLLLMAVLMMSYENRAHAKWSRTIKCL